MPVRSAVTLADGIGEAIVVPDLGAGLATYDLVTGGKRVALFRACREFAMASPFDLANNLMLPWSNRISSGGFYFGGRFHPLSPNLPGEPYPIHGNGFSSTWRVEAATSNRVESSLDSDGPGPFRYAARASYELNAGALTMSVTVVNRGAALPFGLGFHPWIVRTPKTVLQARADSVVLEADDHLPRGDAPISSCPEWDFSAQRALPGGWINNAFRGWDGQASILWLDRGLALDIDADPPLGFYIVYSPSAEAEFFCFEPVTHPVDAHNVAGGPEANGLAVLQPGGSLSIACRFRPRHLG